MFKFIELSQSQMLICDNLDYDIAFIGKPMDERGSKSIEKVNLSAAKALCVNYDSDTFSLQVVDDSFPANGVGIRSFLSKYSSKKILIDATTLDFPEILFLIRSYITLGTCKIGFIYAEPSVYEKKEGLDSEDLHAFNLRDGYSRFAPIPGFTPMLSDSKKARLLAFVGFEATRLKRVLLEDEGDRIKEFSVVFGVPPFQASWEMHSYMQNASVLRETEEVLFVGANNPRSAYNLISEVARASSSSNEVITLAPLGTKPMSIAVALFAAQYRNAVRVIYDYPKTRKNCTTGVARIHHFLVDFSS
jgi:hypothetical protein